VSGRFPRPRLVRIVATNLIRYIFQGAVRNWLRNLGGTTPALGSMSLLLLVSGLIGLGGYALYNLDQIEASQASVLHVYIRDGATGADIIALWNRLAADPRVAGITYTTKSEALVRAQSIPGLPQLADSSESNPFPASLDVQVKTIDGVAAINAIALQDGAVDPVYPTSYDKGAYQRIQSILYGVAVAGFAFLGLLGFVAVTVTVNSITAAIHARREEIAIMQLVGASRWMVRAPFVIEGAITGALAGIGAGLVTFGLAAAGLDAASGAFMQFAPGVTLAVAALAGAIVVLAGLVLGSGSSMISVRRHLEA